jgi:CRISPR-associated protein Cas1
MATLYLDHDRAAIGWKSGAIELRLPGEAPRRLPVRDLDRVVIASSCTISTAALNGLWEGGAAVLLLGGRRHLPGARFSGASHNDATIRLRQLGVITDPTARRAWAMALLAQRLRQMRRVALGLARSRQRGPALLAPALAAIERATQHLASDPPGSLAVLRGIEGALMAAWFGAFARLLPPSLGFAGRRRRPPPDPVNAALSLGYTLATAEAARAATIAGFDVAVGLIHGLAHGRDALALDLVEPARPHVDRMVHDLFHSRRLTDRSVTREPDGAVLLGKAGRQEFYAAWEGEAAPLIRPLLGALCREAVRWLRALPPGPAEFAAHGVDGVDDGAP